MEGIELNISKKEAGKIVEVIQKIASGSAVSAEPISSWEMAEIFQCTHTRIYNRIARFVTAEATEAEKREFQVGYREYRLGRKHPIWRLTEAGCRMYVERMCAEETRSRAFVEGLRRFNEEIDRRFHGVRPDGQVTFLMNGRSRTECGYIKELFDRFITGPAIENREIEELGKKYEEFYQVMAGIKTTAKETSRLESAVMGVAVEAEMQGFIYGFKVFELLAGKALATA